MNIIRCLCIVLVLAVAANASMLHKVRGRAMGSLEASVTGEGRYEFDTIAKQTPLAQGEFQRAWSKGLVVSGVPLRSGKTTDLQFTLTQNGNNFELQAQDEAKDADGNPTKINVIHLTFEEPAYDERALNLNMNMDFTEAAGTAALQRMEEKKKTGDVHASDKIAWCYLAEIGNYYAEDSKGKREFIGTILAKLASDLCDLAGYTHQSLDDGARFRECTNADKSKFPISHMARMVNVFSQGLTFYAKAGFAPCGTRMFEYSRLLATKKQYCESMEAMLKATPASYSAAACRGDASHPFDADRQAECADSERVGECYLKYREAGECAKADAVYKKFLDVRPSAAYGVEAANLNNCPIAKHLAYVETIPRYCRTPESARNAKTSNNDYCKMKKDNGAACKLPGECLSTQCSAGKCCAATGAAADKDSQCCSGKTLGGKCCAANGELVTKAEMCCQTAGEPGPSGKMRCQCAPAGKVVESKSMCCSNTVTIDKKGTTITKKCA